MRATLHIREAGEADAPGVAAVVRASFLEYRDSLDPPTQAWSESAESVGIRLASSTGFLAEISGVTVGAVFARAASGTFYFERLAVHPSYRRQGVAAALIRNVEQRASDLRLSKVTLRARLAQPANIMLFESLGYRIYARGDHPETGESTYALLEKSIGEGTA